MKYKSMKLEDFSEMKDKKKENKSININTNEASFNK